LVVAALTLVLIVFGIYRQTGLHRTKPPVIRV
jgi:hypothetical protein